MKLYYAPLACSLADHIALYVAGVTFDLVRVDMRGKLTETGGDFRQISAKGYVPALVLDDGQVLTENIAVFDSLSDSFPALAVQGPMGRSRQLEAQAFISTEIHRAFKPLWHGGTDRDRARAGATVKGGDNAGRLSVRRPAFGRRLLSVCYAALGRTL